MKKEKLNLLIQIASLCQFPHLYNFSQGFSGVFEMWSRTVSVGDGVGFGWLNVSEPYDVLIGSFMFKAALVQSALLFTLAQQEV